VHRNGAPAEPYEVVRPESDGFARMGIHGSACSRQNGGRGDSSCNGDVFWALGAIADAVYDAMGTAFGVVARWGRDRIHALAFRLANCRQALGLERTQVHATSRPSGHSLSAGSPLTARYLAYSTADNSLDRRR
jgi:hypothetical protein